MWVNNGLCFICDSADHLSVNCNKEKEYKPKEAANAANTADTANGHTDSRKTAVDDGYNYPMPRQTHRAD